LTETAGCGVDADAHKYAVHFDQLFGNSRFWRKLIRRRLLARLQKPKVPLKQIFVKAHTLPGCLKQRVGKVMMLQLARAGPGSRWSSRTHRKQSLGFGVAGWPVLLHAIRL
jgi:hypothetical protein